MDQRINTLCKISSSGLIYTKASSLSVLEDLFWFAFLCCRFSSKVRERIIKICSYEKLKQHKKDLIPCKICLLLRKIGTGRNYATPLWASKSETRTYIYIYISLLSMISAFGRKRRQYLLLSTHYSKSNLIFGSPWNFIKECIIKRRQEFRRKVHDTLGNQETHFLCFISQKWSQVSYFIFLMAYVKKELLELCNTFVILANNIHNILATPFGI